MDLISKIAIKFTSKKVGEDEFGNHYFESKKARNGQKRRFVIYNGMAEPSKIPATWHGWMHYNQDEIPHLNNHHAWQKIHLPNVTGTKMAHTPETLQEDGSKSRKKVSSDYQSWQPE